MLSSGFYKDSRFRIKAVCWGTIGLKASPKYSWVRGDPWKGASSCRKLESLREA